ncbi:MAG TPA: GAF domain-containing protein [Anaerolineaceae bacterium]
MNVRVSSKKASNAPEFRGSLVRLVVIVMLVLTAVPVLLMGTVTYFRSQSMLKNQAMDQIQLVVENYMLDINRNNQNVDRAVSQLISNEGLQENINLLLVDSPNQLRAQAARKTAIATMGMSMITSNGQTITEISVLDPSGKVIVSTNAKREGTSYIAGRGPAELLGKQGTIVAMDPTPLFTSRLMIFTSRTYTSKSTGDKVFTIIAASTATSLQNALIETEKFFPEARAFLFNRSNQVVGLTADDNMIPYENQKDQLTALHTIIDSPIGAGADEYYSWSENTVLAYAKWNPQMNIGLVVEAPATFVYDQVDAQNQMNIIITAAALLVIGLFIWIAASRVVRPLTHLAANVQAFAAGEWGRRTQVTRRDEIGMLAYSFNSMADDLSQLYRSLENKVEERNRQLRTAVEVAQYAGASLDRKEILQRTVDLITERFGYGYAAIYLLDAGRSFFTARAQSGSLAVDDDNKKIGTHIRTHSVFGTVINSNEVQNINVENPEEFSESLLPGALSEAVVPISIGDDVVGVLDIQHSVYNTFGPDMTPALRMVASQVASGLRNITQVENAQVDYKETSLLYRASRKISQASDRDTIRAVMIDTLKEADYVSMIMASKDDQLRATAVIDAQQGVKTPTIIVTLSRIEQKMPPSGYLLMETLDQPSEFFPILNYLHQRGCKQAVFFPVHVAGRLVSLLVLGTSGEAGFPSNTLQQYLSLAEMVTNTYERLHVLDAMQTNLTELRILASVSQSISVETDIRALYQTLLEQIKEVTGGELGFFVALLDKQREYLEFPFIYERGSVINIEPMRFGDGLTSIVIKNEKPLLLKDNAIQQAAALGVKIVGEPARSWLGVPLSLGGEVFGAMVVEDVDNEGRFDEDDLRLFTTIAPQVAVSIRNAQLLTQMQQALHAYDQEHYLLNTLLDNVPDSISFKDEQGRYLLCSASYFEHRGLPAGLDITGKTELDLAPDPETAQQIMAFERQVLENGQPVLNVTSEIPSPDGTTTTWITSDMLPMVDENNEINGLLTIAHDITDVKRAEQLAQLRAQQLLTASEIARDSSGTHNLSELLDKSVNMVRDRFGFYHSSIFLLDALGEYAVLRESTGEAGAHMKSAGHKLAVGSSSIVGQATGTGEPIVVGDVTATANYFANPLLPLTRSELAIPLRISDRILGALDVQSTKENAFSQDDINILQILADQLAIAIFNADLFIETQENLTKHRFLHQITTAAAACTSPDDALRTTVEGMRTAFGSDRVAIYLFDDTNTLTINTYAGYENTDIAQQRVVLGEGAVGLAALGRHPVLVKDTQTENDGSPVDESVRSQLAVPILYTDRTVGVLSVGSSQPAAYDENDQEILGSLGSTLGAILANAQLVSQVRTQVEQQKLLFETTSKIRRTSDINAIMQIATRELAGVLRARRAQIRLTAGQNGAAVDADQPDEETAAAGELRIGSNGNGHHGSAEASDYENPWQELDK